MSQSLYPSHLTAEKMEAVWAVPYRQDKDCEYMPLYGFEFEHEFGDEFSYPAGTERDFRGNFTFHAEGSLRLYGYEFVTSILSEKTILEKPLFDVLEKVVRFNGPTLSSRCSTHIHVNQRNRPLPEFMTFTTLMMIVEPVLMAMAGPERQSNAFCVSNSSSRSDLLSNLMKGLWIFNAITSEKDVYKYDAINFCNLRRLGTLELRMLPPMYKKTDILFWWNIVHLLNKRASEIKDVLSLRKTFLDLTMAEFIDRFIPSSLLKLEAHVVATLLRQGYKNAMVMFTLGEQYNFIDKLRKKFKDDKLIAYNELEKLFK